jgi:hypothetical protein
MVEEHPAEIAEPSKSTSGVIPSSGASTTGAGPAEFLLYAGDRGLDPERKKAKEYATECG